MDLVLVIDSEHSSEELLIKIQGMFWGKLGIDTKIKIRKDFEDMTMHNEFFTSSLDINTTETEMAYLESCCYGEHQLVVNRAISIQLYPNEKALNILFRLIKELLKDTSNDIGLMGLMSSNSGNPIVKRVNGKLWAMDDRKEYYFDFPFYEIHPDLKGDGKIIESLF